MQQNNATTGYRERFFAPSALGFLESPPLGGLQPRVRGASVQEWLSHHKRVFTSGFASELEQAGPEHCSCSLCFLQELIVPLKAGVLLDKSGIAPQPRLHTLLSPWNSNSRHRRKSHQPLCSASSQLFGSCTPEDRGAFDQERSRAAAACCIPGFSMRFETVRAGGGRGPWFLTGCPSCSVAPPNSRGAFQQERYRIADVFCIAGFPLRSKRPGPAELS